MSGIGSEKKNRNGYSFNNSAQLLRSGHEFFDALENLVDSAVHALRYTRDRGVEFFSEDARPSKLKDYEPLF